MIGAEIAFCIYENLVHRVSENIFGSNVFQVNAVNIGAHFHVVRHLRSCYHIVNGKGMVLYKLRINEALVRELSVGSFLLSLLIDLFHTLYDLKQPCSARNTVAFE